MALDVTECLIQKPLDYAVQKLFYSGKVKAHTVKYEIETELETGNIVWFCGFHPDSIHDLTIAKNSTILKYLLSGEFILADKAYIGHSSFITPFKKPKTQAEQLVNSLIYKRRVIVENTLNRIKSFTFTQKEWRHKIELHALAMKFIANVVNIDLKFRPVRKN
jgi:hypothetical protein